MVDVMTAEEDITGRGSLATEEEGTESVAAAMGAADVAENPGAGQQEEAKKKKKKKKKVKEAAPSVFESTPSASQADAHCSEHTMDAADMAQSTFESNPSQSAADTGHAVSAPIEPVEEQSVFESTPQESQAADTGHSVSAPMEPVAAAMGAADVAENPGAGQQEEAKKKKKKKKKVKEAAPSVFESTPAVSQADAHCSEHTTDAADMAQSTFESTPSQSAADSGHAVSAPMEPVEEQSVFESTPQESRADADTVNSVSAPMEPVEEQSVFESTPQESKATYAAGRQDVDALAEGAETEADKSVFESEPVKSTAAVTHSDKVAEQTDTAIQSVFESVPVDSKASAKAGLDGAGSESEYETDDEYAKHSTKHGSWWVRDEPVEEQSVFESTPRESQAADTGHSVSAPMEPVEEQSVFESTPLESKATFAAGRQDVDAQAEWAETEASKSVFESEPVKSTAAVTHSDKVAEQEDTAIQSVFESNPVDSKAHAKAGLDGAGSESEYETDEEEAEHSTKNRFTAAVTHSDKVAEQEDTAIQSVFESNPVDSKAHAKSGHDGGGMSESEYETDEEES
eukprot:CAMPEP_0172937534 /NCGR_PEP_ID=MMETSP1075-20121228/222568_1 /TAXON_ID=2916 /ORGANISM="Ceratium fusus, Strain PA161109" /LENGTH=571 /DNA_ID=CAMNT_0013798909 /DNA_START=12 /DNA_END=1729 /DNA_ORIENTATION=+